MRTLTFKGFMTQYVKDLSESGTLDITVLADEAGNGNYRLCAPLVIFAVLSGKQKRLSGSLGGSAPAEEMRDMLCLLSDGDPEKVLSSGGVPREYSKVLDSYHAARNAPERDKELKDAVRTRVLDLMRSGSCTNYRIYTDLKLNPGNINSWLKNGDPGKVSCGTAARILKYVERFSEGRKT